MMSNWLIFLVLSAFALFFEKISGSAIDTNIAVADLWSIKNQKNPNHRRRGYTSVKRNNAHRAVNHHNRRSFLPGSVGNLSIPTTKSIATTSTSTMLDSTIQPIVWRDKQIIEELLKRYRFPDSHMNISVAVMLNIDRLLTSEHVDDLCRIQLSITQKWMEPRLAFKDLRDDLSKPIKIRSLSYFWNPALAIENALNVLPVRKDSLNIFPNGVIEYNQVVQVVNEAETNLDSFPFEKRNCSLLFSNDDSRAIWHRMTSIGVFNSADESDEPSDNGSPVAEFAVTSVKMRGYRRVEIRLKRFILPWITSLFVPSAVLLLASWIQIALCGNRNFNNYYSSATFIGIIIVLTLNVMLIPRTNTLKAIDMWSGVIFVGSMITFLYGACYKRQRQEEDEYFDEIKRIYERSSGDGKKYSTLPQMPYYTNMRSTRRFLSRSRKCCSFVNVLHALFICVFPFALIAFFVYFFIVFVYPFYWK